MVLAWLLMTASVASASSAAPGRLVVVEAAAGDGLHALAILTGAGVTLASALLGFPGGGRRR